MLDAKAELAKDFGVVTKTAEVNNKCSSFIVRFSYSTTIAFNAKPPTLPDKP